MTDTAPVFGIDFAPLANPLRRFRRGQLNLDDLLVAIANLKLMPVSALPDGGVDVVTTAVEFHRRLLDSGAFECWDDNPAEWQRRATEVLIAVVFKARTTVVGDPRLRTQVRRFGDYWAAQLAQFVVAAPADLRVQYVGMAAARGLDGLLPTELLLESLSATADPTSVEFDHGQHVGATLVRRFVDEGNDDRAITFAANFGCDAHRLLLEVARVLPAESVHWAALTALLNEQRALILADGDWTAVLYAAANAARCAQPDSARTLLAMVQLEDAGPLPDPEPRFGARHNLRIELHALAAVIHQAVGRGAEALRSAKACARLAAELAAQSEFDDDDAWVLPKAAGWLLATAERDPAARVVLLKRAYCKYDLRGALEGRLALQAATAYLVLGQPELAAYFLAQATENTRLQLISDHFVNAVRWDYVGELLEQARVTEPELSDAGAALRLLGYLPEPVTGQHFWWIDEQWYRALRSDNPALVSPEPKRA